MAGKMTVNAYVNVSGPLFDGQADDAVKRFTEDVRKAIADEGARMLREFPMDKTGRARGGFQENLRVLTSGNALRIRGPLITGVAWTPWLEGTSERNRSTSFKGYHLFRKTRLELDRKSGEIAQRELEKFLPEMGGK